jgi:hypothetical protein
VDKIYLAGVIIAFLAFACGLFAASIYVQLDRPPANGSSAGPIART